MTTIEDKQRVLGIIRHLEKMSQTDKSMYTDVMTNHPQVAELIQNEARLSPDAVALFERIQRMMRAGNTRGVAELLRT
ncbi:MAG: hypothetical protein A4E28_00006 [Methanocella sp. PtaU1.Bin125]|nr:MAG: hypothetical protein A4E28_00006 [Methanocella sp. PtaU1.Bin125]